ncbi:sialate O-acetylesterase [Hymenobacter psychrotolerans]|uniref:Sialate O-acetylesterase n=1 Tax=Hymenobacter psychrotolerans DSM 18569 TaxID=1121959 RepID=A0A1M7DVU7_9BACT|nr:sialate O-acetylesterase [Hymenobacter psychrotolerans]SHL83625.1 sialate O-acetylesterase [Hymenobacter psychrotolerans DSM 18569]
MRRSFCFLLALLAHSAFADVTLPALITDNMVLQQKSTVALWGWATPGEAVTVMGGWQKKPVKATADAQGNWLVRVPTGKAGGPYTLTVQGNNQLTINNVLLGEVWLCSGQSNMAFPISKGASNWMTGVQNEAEVLPKATYPAIRMFTVAQKVADEPQRDVQGSWVVCSPQTVGTFSAVAYFFGQEIHAKTGVPVGLIHSSWGGTPAESWTRREVLEQNPELRPILTRYADGLTQRPAYETALAAWKREKERNPKSTKLKPAEPLSATSNKSPAKLYNGMIRGLEPYTLRGTIWYQGESNAERAYQYRTLFPALIASWRQAWQQPTMPFYFVQIAPHKGQNPEIREAQLVTWQTVPNTGMVVTTDVGDSLDIHPRDKQTVGLRLARWALRNEYGQSKLEASGPLYKYMKKEGDKVRIIFEHAEGLQKTSGLLREFTVAGADSVFHPAQARLDGSTVVVWSEQVPQPVAVRFGWSKSPMPNLFNAAGLPASPFRTDAWPTPTQGKN